MELKATLQLFGIIMLTEIATEMKALREKRGTRGVGTTIIHCRDGLETKDVVTVTVDEQLRALNQSLLECTDHISRTTTNVTVYGFCPATWDGIMCWPETPPTTVVELPCPPYINMFIRTEFAMRECLSNGSWWHPKPTSFPHPGWTNYTNCICTNNVSKTDVVPPKPEGFVEIMTRYEDELRLMYNIGYVLSLVSLLCAILVMSYFKKLHCARNYIHLNLFISFVLRAALSIIRDNTWIHHLGFPKDVQELPNGTVTYTNGPHWECRAFFTLYQYVLVASYMWIFMEAIYIHMVIFVVVFTEKARVIWFIIIGWTLPFPFVLAWAICRAVLDNEFCWQLPHKSPGLVWFIQTPVMITVVLNFLFFINIVRLLFTKLNTFPNAESNRARTLAKSIVVLIPLFGVYYILVAFPIEHVEDTASFVLLFIEMFFNSYQGLFIAVLLCFVNGEVRAEIRKCWNRLEIRRLSTVSRASQYYTQTTRSLSATRLSDAGRHLPLVKRFGRKTSASDLEHTVPLNTPVIKIERNQTEPNLRNTEAIEMKRINSKKTENGLNLTDSDKLQFKINVVNIECRSRDGLSKYTTSLNIQALKDGRTVSAENMMNNNVQARKESEIESNETDSLLQTRSY